MNPRSRLLLLTLSVLSAGCADEGRPDHTRDATKGGTPAAPNYGGSARDRAQGTPGIDAAHRAPDNTDVNERDVGGNTLTPMDQSEKRADIEITAEIRRQIIADASMSPNARNVKIMTTDGVVTLRGPVPDLAERSAIEATASAVAGVQRVDDQLEVQAD